MNTTNVEFTHKRELLLAKYAVVRELSLLTKNLLTEQQFEAATAVSARLDANCEEFAEQLKELKVFDQSVAPDEEKPLRAADLKDILELHFKRSFHVLTDSLPTVVTPTTPIEVAINEALAAEEVAPPVV